MTNRESHWVQPKWFAESRVFWLNVFCAAAAFVLLLMTQQSGMPLMLLVQSLINLVLRFLTEQPVQLLRPRV